MFKAIEALIKKEPDLEQTIINALKAYEKIEHQKYVAEAIGTVAAWTVHDATARITDAVRKTADTLMKYESRGKGDEIKYVAEAIGKIARWTENPCAVEHVCKLIRLGTEPFIVSKVPDVTDVFKTDFQEKPKEYYGSIYFMREAIGDSPVDIKKIAELGLSQASRLLLFLNKKEDYSKKIHVPDISDHLKKFKEFPIIGAEFTLPSDAIDPSRLVILNMSQYHKGSLIPLSAKEGEQTEIRMNPSFYPVTIANWSLMKELIPQLNNAYFRVCISGINLYDETKIELLNSLGSIVYANFFKSAEKAEGELDFGEWYTGQTVELKDEKYTAQALSQLNLYLGFGNSLPAQTYYLSIACVDDAVLKIVEKNTGNVDIFQACSMDIKDVRNTLEQINAHIIKNSGLMEASRCGQEIINMFGFHNSI